MRSKLNISKLVVLGGGESGVGAAVLGLKKGYDVLLSDRGEIKQNYKDVLLKYNIEFEHLAHVRGLLRQNETTQHVSEAGQRQCHPPESQIVLPWTNQKQSSV